MTTEPKPPLDMKQVLLTAGARVCGRCGELALLPARGSGNQIWFCFDCGNEERQASPALTVATTE